MINIYTAWPIYPQCGILWSWCPCNMSQRSAGRAVEAAGVTGVGSTSVSHSDGY